MRPRLVILFLLLSLQLFSEDRLLRLEGYLRQQDVSRVEQAVAVNPDKLAIWLSSDSADVHATMDIAKVLYQWKRVQGGRLTLFIEEEAIGPAAILPFLADQLVTTPFVSWGDILLGAGKRVPPHLMRSQVVGLLNGSQQLKRVAEGMVEREGDPLVLNQSEIAELGIPHRFLTKEQWQALFATEFSVTTKASAGLERVPAEVVQQMEEHITADPENTTIGYLRIDDKKVGINQSTWIQIKSALDYYRKNPPAFIILDLNTPGGQVYASQQISDALKALDTELGIPTVAYINNWAISAGAMLAYSCRFITVVKDASMGAAEPVLQDSQGQMKTASEKVNSALRADFANRAQFFGRNPLLAKAMVDKDLLLVLRHGEIVQLQKTEEIDTTSRTPDKVITRKGKLLTLNAEEMVRLGVADALLPPARLEMRTPAELSSGRWPLKKMLLAEHPFFARYADTKVDAWQPDWRVSFLSFLSHPIVASALFLGIMMGIYMELSTPGLGFPGVLAIICLGGTILSSFALDAVGWLELILIAGGLGLLALEIFVIPGFGVAGVVGIGCLIVGIFGLTLPALDRVTFDPNTQTWNAAGDVFMERLAWLSGGLLLGIVGIGVLARYMTPRLRGLQYLVLQGEEEASDGYFAGPHAEELPSVGAEGISITPLRPAGKIEIAGKLYDAVSLGDFILEGAYVRVAELRGSKIIVVAKEHE